MYNTFANSQIEKTLRKEQWTGMLFRINEEKMADKGVVVIGFACSKLRTLALVKRKLTSEFANSGSKQRQP
jgi:hypothetical protein